MSAFTPGPWEVDDLNWHRINESGTGDMVCWISDTEHPDAQRQANARLIAAAPEMYEALKAICQALKDAKDGYGGGVPVWADCWDKAEAAFAKATGGQS